MCPAIHINSRSWLRSSSTREPSDPPLRVVSVFHFLCRSRKRATTTVAASTRNGSWDIIPYVKDTKRQSRRGGRKSIDGSLNLRNAGDVGAHALARLHRQHAHLDKTRNRDRYPDTSTSIHGPQDDSQRPVFTPSAGRPRRTPGDVRHSVHSVSISLLTRSAIDSCVHHGNDPSAGSPTETLLRLLLPLDDQV